MHYNLNDIQQEVKAQDNASKKCEVKKWCHESLDQKDRLKVDNFYKPFDEQQALIIRISMGSSSDQKWANKK